MSEVTITEKTAPPWNEPAKQVVCGKARVLVFATRYQVEDGLVGTPADILDLFTAINTAADILHGGS